MKNPIFSISTNILENFFKKFFCQKLCNLTLNFILIQKMVEITEREKKSILEKCHQAMLDTSWFNNVSFKADCTILQAIQAARDSKDAGLQGALQLTPTSNNFHEWMNYVHLITIYYNVGKTTKKYTILRIGWIKMIKPA